MTYNSNYNDNNEYDNNNDKYLQLECIKARDGWKEKGSFALLRLRGFWCVQAVIILVRNNRLCEAQLEQLSDDFCFVGGAEDLVVANQYKESHTVVIRDDRPLVLAVDDFTECEYPVRGVTGCAIQMHCQLAWLGGVLVVSVSVDGLAGSVGCAVGLVVVHRQGTVSIGTVISGDAVRVSFEGLQDNCISIDLIPTTQVLLHIQCSDSRVLAVSTDWRISRVIRRGKGGMR